MNDIKQKIREFLKRYLRNHELKDDDDIFGLGFVNSLIAMQLVTFVESEFGITIDNDDLDFENFKSIAAITELIGRKALSAAPTGAAG